MSADTNAIPYVRRQPSPETIAGWQDYKFGMFIHWGLYALLGRGEWVLFNEQLDVDEYRALMDAFRAEAFDATAWARLAEEAGMKYAVLTSRHHDGFSLFASEASHGDFTSMQAACERDFVREYTDACRAAGLGVGLYYSPMDWRFPGFFAPKMYRRSARAMKKQCHGQIEELLSNYGTIDILWYDGGNDFWMAHARDIRHNHDTKYTQENPLCPGFWDGDRLDQMARALQPEIMINERIGAMNNADFHVAEGKVGSFNFDAPWESCFTLAGSWGYTENCVPRSLRACVQTLVKTVVGGGNLLLNVGPRPDGTIPTDQADRLREIGEWLAAYGETIYGTRGGPLPPEHWGGTTCRGNTLYVHILEWRNNEVTIPAGEGELKNCESLTASDVALKPSGDSILISVPAGDRQDIDTILKLTFDRPAVDVYPDMPRRA